MPLTLWRDVVDTPTMNVRITLLENEQVVLEVTYYRGNGAVDRSFVGVLPAAHSAEDLHRVWSYLLESHLQVASVQAIAGLRRIGREMGCRW